MSDIGSIYDPPASDLLVKEELPEKYLTGPLTRTKLKRIGWVALMHILVGLPVIVTSFYSAADGESEIYFMLSLILDLISTLLFVYLLVMFKLFLNLRFNYPRVNAHIIILIILSLIMVVDSFFMSNRADDMPGMATLVYFILMVVFGVIIALFGKRLLAINANFKYLRLYAWTNILLGVCLASVILFLLALPIGLVSSFALMMIFFTASDELKSEAV